MLGFAQRLEREGIEVSTLSGSPDESYRIHNIRAVPRRDMRLVKQEIEQHDALVFPGGSIFQDATSFRSVLYYANLVSLAKKARKRVLLLAQGVGPLKTWLGKRQSAAAYNDADHVTVRDPQSAALLKEIGVTKPVRVTADSAFLMPFPTLLEDTQNFAVGNMRTVAIAPRPVKGIDMESLIGEFCRRLFQSGTMPLLVPMDREEDAPLIQAISNKQGGKIPDLKRIDSPVDVQRRLARVDSVVAVRLHAGILAASVRVPPLMLSYDPKVTAFARSLDIGGGLPLQGLTPDRLFDHFMSFQKSRDRNAELMERKTAEFARMAEENIQIVVDTLRRPGVA